MQNTKVSRNYRYFQICIWLFNKRKIIGLCQIKACCLHFSLMIINYCNCTIQGQFIIKLYCPNSKPNKCAFYVWPSNTDASDHQSIHFYSEKIMMSVCELWSSVNKSVFTLQWVVPCFFPEVWTVFADSLYQQTTSSCYAKA